MVFTDLHMAGLHGSDMIRMIKADEELKAIPVEFSADCKRRTS
jgi:hypothetical protein